MVVEATIRLHDRGRPPRDGAPSASSRSFGSLVAHPTTRREQRSRIAARYNQPSAVRTHVSPYASGDYRTALVRRGFVASMSRRGDCWDNAVAESFFATLKGEHVDHETYATRDAATRSIADYIDNFYNVQRRHSSIGCISPMEYELRLQARREAA